MNLVKITTLMLGILVLGETIYLYQLREEYNSLKNYATPPKKTTVPTQVVEKKNMLEEHYPEHPLEKMVVPEHQFKSKGIKGVTYDFGKMNSEHGKKRIRKLLLSKEVKDRVKQITIRAIKSCGDRDYEEILREFSETTENESLKRQAQEGLAMDERNLPIVRKYIKSNGKLIEHVNSVMVTNKE